MSAPELSIVICTMRRVAFLRALLDALAAQTGSVPGLEVIVVDNDPAASARGVTAPAGLALQLVHEPRAGVSHARNRGVALAAAATILFLDDDQLLAPDALAALWRVWLERPPHVRGLRLKVEAHHAATAPESALRKPGAARPDYAPVDRASFGTGGLVLERTLLGDDDPPFDPALTRGEDTDLFLRLVARGYHVGHLASVAVAERVTPERRRLRYELASQYLSGRLDTRLDTATRVRFAAQHEAQRHTPSEVWRQTDLNLRISGQRDGWPGIAPPARLDPLRRLVRRGLALRHPVIHLAGILVDVPWGLVRPGAPARAKLAHLAYLAGRLSARARS